jgi:hypothetical protein
MMSERTIAPVILFTYNRPEHTKHTIETLAANELADRTDLFVFSDAAKPQKDDSEAARKSWEENKRKVQEIRDYVTNITGFASVTLTARTENYGLAKNVIEGVTEIVNRYGKVIVLEDDLVTNPYFLRFMNDGLERYAEEKKVTGVTGFSFLDDSTDYPEESYLCGLTGTSWSWATWADRWSCFDAEAEGWERLKEDKEYRKRFNYDNTYNFYQLLKMQKEDARTNSWAIRWYYSTFLRDGLILVPTKSLVGNDGWDGSGVHCGGEAPTAVHALRTEHAITEFPAEIEEKPELRKRLKKELLKISEPSRLKWMYHNIFRKNYIGQA